MFGRIKHTHRFTDPRNVVELISSPSFLGLPTYPGVARFCLCGSVEVTRYDFGLHSAQWGINSQQVYNATAWRDLTMIYPPKGRKISDDLVAKVEADLRECK